MAKNKEKVDTVEEKQEGSVEVEATKEKLRAAVVLGVDSEGKLVIQDGQLVFGEDQIEHQMTDDLYIQIIKNIHRDIEKEELAQAVKEIIAKSFGGVK